MCRRAKARPRVQGVPLPGLKPGFSRPPSAWRGAARVGRPFFLFVHVAFNECDLVNFQGKLWCFSCCPSRESRDGVDLIVCVDVGCCSYC